MPISRQTESAMKKTYQISKMLRCGGNCNLGCSFFILCLPKLLPLLNGISSPVLIRYLTIIKHLVTPGLPPPFILNTASHIWAVLRSEEKLKSSIIITQIWKKKVKERVMSHGLTLRIWPGSPSSRLFMCLALRLTFLSLWLQWYCCGLLVTSPILPLSRPDITLTISPNLTCILQNRKTVWFAFFPFPTL